MTKFQQELKKPNQRDARKVLKLLYNLGDSYKDLYASTVHKAQGVSIRHCFVYLDDLLLSKTIPHALLYTAFSRASEQLYIIKD
ncbi:C-terminal helicase domain-containing protein [Okeania sp. KiyG1]|uniref:C-terminal helicase domain-containing protein n=1 Tax=Okeania sp. KiyG1 TaxID=2720165 RepID=UPI0035C92834